MKIHLPAIVSTRGSVSRNSKKRVFDAVLGTVAVTGSSPAHARILLQEAVLQWASSPIPYIKVAQDGTIFMAFAGIGRGTCTIRMYNPTGSHIGTDADFEVEEGQNVDWILGQAVLGWDAAQKTERRLATAAVRLAE